MALVHDWLNQAGGAEVVLRELHELFPEAPIVTSIWDPDVVAGTEDWPVRTTWLNRIPGIQRHHQPFLPAYPLVWGRTNVYAELLISNKSGFCHGVNYTGARHVCYCLTPTRFVWQPEAYLRAERLPPGAGMAARLLLPWLRRWDRRAADRVDEFVAISHAVAERIARWYDRDSVVIHPPAHIERFAPAAVEDHYLILARLVPYKAIDLAITAFNALGRPLWIVGEGRDRSRLEGLAGPTVRFLGRLPDDEAAHVLARCRALIWPGVEDYGIAPVEAMAAGRPVIALDAGGVRDTVIPGTTGVLFAPATVDALVDAVKSADNIEWDADVIVRHAEQFSASAFRRRLRAYLAGPDARSPNPTTGPSARTRRRALEHAP